MKKYQFLIFLVFIFCSLAATAEMLSYKIVAGDTLYSLSKRFNVSVEEILSVNSMGNDSLRVDSIIFIPEQNVTESYIVQKGDTLYSLSRQFNINLNTLMDMNGISSSTILKEGDILIIKSSQSANVTVNENTEQISIKKNEENTEKSGNETQPVIILDVSHKSGEWVAPPRWPVGGEKSDFSGNIEGVIIHSEPGTWVVSVSSGRVVWTGDYREFGKVVLIDSGEYLFFYGGNREINVNIGENVSTGSSIGRLNYNQSATTVPMYFTVFQNGNVVDVDLVPRG